MLGSLLRALILIVVLLGAGAFLLGWWGGGTLRPGDSTRPVGTSGIDTQKAREVGAAVGEKTAAAAGHARQALNDGSITAKIKAKMALDDTVKALDVHVNTDGTRVTVSGTVDTTGQRDKVLQLARETDGVKTVVDQLQVRRGR
jgi:hyperosmotically inducible protein